MLIVIDQNPESSSIRAANIVAALIRNKPWPVLGLATGKSPLGLYRELIRMHKEDGLDLSHVTTFNLDEYYGISKEHPQSFYRQIHQEFLDHVNILPGHTHIPDGSDPDFHSTCEKYEQAITDAGGIDIQILGIGRTGHIGFNEPTSSLASRTRLKTLSNETIDDNRSYDIPTVALTMGIGTILEARHMLLLAYGEAKSDALVRSIEGPITSSVSASALQLHRNVTVLADESAAAKLTHRDYYDRVVEQTAKYSPERLGIV